MIDLATARLILEFTNSDYFGIRQTYYENIKQSVVGFLANTGSRVTAFQNDARQAMTESFPTAFYAGYADGGGDPDNVDPDDDAWLTARMNAETGFIGVTFQNMRQMKLPGDMSASDIDDQGDQTATAYANTLDGIYNEGKLRGAGNKMLVFAGEDGEESCQTCQKLKGQRHKASYWVSHGLVPGVPGNTNYICGGWNCQHYLEDKDGNLFTI